MIRFDPNRDLCPCESGKLLQNCCMGLHNTLKTTPSPTCPPAPKTGFSNPRCYASQLADCSEKLSHEHSISHGILKLLSHDGSVTIDGFNWQEEKNKQELPTSRLASKVLCKRHNEALSPLDATAVRFFTKLDNVIRQTERRSQVFLFDGTDLEHWMLKTLCGTVFSGNADIKRAQVTNWKPDLLWLNILFDAKPFPDRWGLYYSAESADTVEGGIKLSALANSTDGVYGVRISLDDELFLFLMDTPPEDATGTYLTRYTYRPKAIGLQNAYCENVILFGWNDEFQHDTPPMVKYET